MEVKCTNGNTKVLGAVIGEFPLNGRGGSSQYGVSEKAFLLLFKASGVRQEPEEIELLGNLMTEVGLKVEGFFGEKASEEAAALILSDGSSKLAGEEREAGEETEIRATFQGETGTITNPTKKMLSLEILEFINTGGGAVTNNNCKPGLILSGGGVSTCTFKQAAPQGAKVRAVWL